MSEKSAYVIVSLVGVAGLLLYSYLLVMGDIAPENQKYTVIAASVGLLYPIISLSNNEDIKLYGWKVFGVGFAGLCIILISGYATKVQTSEGVIWDFLNAVTTKEWLYFYLFLLIVAHLFPLVLKKYSIWVIPFVIGFMIPVLIASLLALAIFVAGLYLVSLYGKSNNTSNSWSSVFSSSSKTTNNTAPQKTVKSTQTKGVDNKRYAYFLVTWGSDALNHTSWTEAFPVDMTHDQISKYMKRAHVVGDGSSLVSVKFVRYTTKDNVSRLAFEIYNQ